MSLYDFVDWLNLIWGVERVVVFPFLFGSSYMCYLWFGDLLLVLFDTIETYLLKIQKNKRILFLGGQKEDIH